MWNACSPDELVTLALKETSRAVLIGYGKTDVSERAKPFANSTWTRPRPTYDWPLPRFYGPNRLKAHPDAPFLLSRDDVKSAIAGLKSSEPPPGSQTTNKAGKP